MGELVTRADLQTAIAHLKERLEAKLEKLDAKIGNVSLRMTVRPDVMLAASIAVLGAMIKLT